MSDRDDPRDSFSLDGEGGAWSAEARSDGKRWSVAGMRELKDEVGRKRQQKKERGDKR